MKKIFVILVCLSIVLGFSASYFAIYQVKGVGMEPTLQKDQNILAISHPYKPLRGNIAIYTNNSDGVEIGRIVGLPGESVRVFSGKVYLKFDQSSEILRLQEDYLNQPTTESINHDWADLSLDEYFIISDNRNPLQIKFTRIKKSQIKGLYYSKL
jgi:signal peptidase I